MSESADPVDPSVPLDGDPLCPVEEIPEKRRGVYPGVALCLSGGGYRAMLFHAGALWRLNETGHLARLDRVSSVSGGSITAAVLGLHWKELELDNFGIARNFAEIVVRPLRAMASVTVDVRSIVGGILSPGSISDKVIAAYRRHLLGEATLQDLPDRPRFVFNATNVQSGALWRFMKPYMRDYRVGEVKNPRVQLAVAVAASSAFPPFLSPVKLELDPSLYSPPDGYEDLHFPPYTTEVILCDGGVYDNLGLETAWKRYETVLVSDAGGKMAPDPDPSMDWPRQSRRMLELIDNQVRCLRKRQVVGSFREGLRKGAYWGIRSNIEHFKLPDSLPAPYEDTMKLAAMDTRLAALTNPEQERLINWGYAICDAALRRHVDPSLRVPRTFPYSATGVA